MKSVADFSNAEKEAIENLRRRMCGDMKKEMLQNNILLYRYLKARNFNLDDAEKMLRNMLKWRKEIDYDKILEYEPPEILISCFGKTAVCHDKEGSSVHYLPSGKLDIKGLRLAARADDMRKTLFKIFAEEELYQEEFEKRDVVPPGYVHIHDFEGFTLAQAMDMKAIEFFIGMAKSYQDYYPEREKTSYVINAPPAFAIAFSIVKHVFAPALQKKIRVYHTDSWKEDLLKEIDKDKLPAFLGGTRTDPDGNPRCLTYLNHGGLIPESFYIHRSTRSLKEFPDAKTLVIPRGSQHEMLLEVPEQGSCVQWEFETKSGDIRFGIFLRGEGTEDAEVVPMTRCNSDDFSEKGVHECGKGGTYVVVFDNSYSWVKSKEVYYILKVKKRGR